MLENILNSRIWVLVSVVAIIIASSLWYNASHNRGKAYLLDSEYRDNQIVVKALLKSAAEDPEYLVLDKYRGVYRTTEKIWGFLEVNHKYVVDTRADYITHYVTSLNDYEAEEKITELRRKLKYAQKGLKVPVSKEENSWKFVH